MPSWTRRSADNGRVADVLQLLITRIEQLGLDAEGLYRVSGPHSQVKMIHTKSVQALQSEGAARDLVKALDKVHSLLPRTLS